MKRKILTAIVIAAAIFGCTKEENVLTSSKNTNDIETSRNGDAVQGSRTLTMDFVNGELMDIRCRAEKGDCLPDVVVSGRVAYEQLLNAIKTDEQMVFFNKISYADVFGVDEIHHIQDGLEKGHLKIRILNGSEADYFLFLKPQHEKFDVDKLIDKVVMTIPVVE